MKKHLLLSVSFFFSLFVSAQCDTAGFNFGDAPFGVSPDPNVGETFIEGAIGESYSDTIFLIIPTDAGDIVEGFDGAPVDSVVLSSVTLSLNGTNYSLADVGLNYECNNGEGSPNDCTYYGGQQGCARLFGIPTMAGQFSVTVTVTGWTTIFQNPFSQPVVFDQYILDISGPVSIASTTIPRFEVYQNMPNPFTGTTDIRVDLNQAAKMKLEVMNLLGDVVISEQIMGSKGKNMLKVNSDELNPGVYLYTIEVAGIKTTKRMVVNK
jgi:hypothetical protein